MGMTGIITMGSYFVIFALLGVDYAYRIVKWFFAHSQKHHKDLRAPKWALVSWECVAGLALISFGWGMLHVLAQL